MLSSMLNITQKLANTWNKEKDMHQGSSYVYKQDNCEMCKFGDRVNSTTGICFFDWDKQFKSDDMQPIVKWNSTCNLFATKKSSKRW